MKEYAIQIKETLSMIVTVKANSALEAKEMAERGWEDGDYVLDAENFSGVTFCNQRNKELER